jgi:alkylhydroperoxidase family enzyme
LQAGMARHHGASGVHQEVRARFTDAELVKLTLAIVSINAWNRFNIAFRIPAGNYQPGMFKHLEAS